MVLMTALKRHTMINRYSVSLLMRSEVATSGSRKPIYLRAYVNKKRVMISTYVSVPIANWSVLDQRVIHVAKGVFTKKECSDLNVILDSILNRGQKLFIKFQISGEMLTAEDYKYHVQSGTEHSDFHDFIRRFLVDYQKTVAKNTMKNVNRAVALLKEFKSDISIYELNPALVMKFEGFMKSKGYNGNTRGKHHRIVKLLALRVVDKYGIRHPYLEFKMPKSETEREYLLSGEVQELVRLHRQKKLNQVLQMVLGKYLFSCHCGGLRISDIHRVGWDDVVNDMLVFVPEKTKGLNKTVKIPFTKEHSEWIENKVSGRFFDLQSDQHINRGLKRIAQELGWKKQLTFHTARHTFATGYLEAGGSIEVLQQILRHGKIETTQVYVHITNDRIREESRNMNMYDK